MSYYSNPFMAQFASVNRESYFFSDDFASNTWTQVGTGTSITNNEIQGWGADGTDRRVWKALSSNLSDTAWVCRFKFIYSAQNNPAHYPLYFCSVSTDNDASGTGDLLGMLVGINANELRTTYVDSGDTGGNGVHGTVITGSISTQYYIEIKRTSSTALTIGIFSDSEFSSHISGSPQTQTIPSTVINLGFIHSGNASGGGTSRTLTGIVDDIYVKNGVTSW